MNYQEAYKILFNGITNALFVLNSVCDRPPEVMRAQILLQSVQRQTENMYIEAK